jgi:hypothetical protein
MANYPMQYRRPAPVRQQTAMPLRSILGNPGKFFDPRTKKVYDISQAYEGDKFDTVGLPHGVVLTTGQYLWFQNLQSKTRIDTNFKTQNRLDPNERMVLERIGLYVHTANGSTINLFSDIKMALENGFIRLTINDDILWEGLSTWLPSGLGLYGNSSETDATFVTVGVPGTAAAARLRRKQMLTERHSLGGYVEYQARAAWMALQGGLSAYVGPTLTNDVLVKIVFHGPISRPATR